MKVKAVHEVVRKNEETGKLETIPAGKVFEIDTTTEDGKKQLDELKAAGAVSTRKGDIRAAQAADATDDDEEQEEDDENNGGATSGGNLKVTGEDATGEGTGTGSAGGQAEPTGAKAKGKTAGKPSGAGAADGSDLI